MKVSVAVGLVERTELLERAVVGNEPIIQERVRTGRFTAITCSGKDLINPWDLWNVHNIPTPQKAEHSGITRNDLICYRVRPGNDWWFNHKFAEIIILM